jgi:hypothetical protein
MHSCEAKPVSTVHRAPEECLHPTYQGRNLPGSALQEVHNELWRAVAQRQPNNWAEVTLICWLRRAPCGACGLKHIPPLFTSTVECRAPCGASGLKRFVENSELAAGLRRLWAATIYTNSHYQGKDEYASLAI